MTPSQEFTYVRTYSRWIPRLRRRETYGETTERYLKFVSDELGIDNQRVIDAGRAAILAMDAMPSMRAFWAAGTAAKDNHITMYNCSYLTVNCIEAFSETLYILMCGTGVGFSVEDQYVSQLPELQPRNGRTVKVVVEDSKLGWAESLHTVLTALWNGSDVEIDDSRVRPRGARLLTMGGRASGPEPLRDLFKFLVHLFKEKRARGLRRLTDIDCQDIQNKIAEIVVVGGVRRSSEISLSDLDSRAIAEAKMGEFWNSHPHRSMSNNSAVYLGRPDVVTFMEEFTTLIKSKAGERGIFNREGAMKQMTASGRRATWQHIGTNPCVPGWTKVLTKDGYQPIETLVGREVEVWNGFEWSSVKPAITGRQQPLVDVLLSSGQSLTCTPYHEFVVAIDYTGMSRRVKAKDLLPGMKLAKHEYPVVEIGEDHPTAYTQGFISGDGMNGYKHLCLYSPKFCCLARLGGRHKELDTGKDLMNVWFDFDPLPKEFVPEGWSVKSRLDWFAGLLDADGTVLVEGGTQLGSINLDFLLRVQRMLTTLGTASKVISANKAGMRGMPDGKGGTKEYYCQDCFRLCIGSAEMQHLVSLGLKTERLKLSGFQPNRSASRFVMVVDVVDAGTADTVYCFTEDKRHMGCFEGVVTGQCGEIILRDQEFCNLSEVVVRSHDNLESLKRKVRTATMFGVWQSAFTKFPYLRPEWAKNCEEERLLGVSLTGLMDHAVLNNVNDKAKRWLAELKGVALAEAERWAKKLDINFSAAVTCVKPSGTVSQLVNCASGIHQRWAQWYIRRYRISATDPLFHMLKDQGVPYFPEVGQDPESASTMVLEFPIAAPKGCKTRHDFDSMQQLDHWKMVKEFWCEHNPSVTVYVGEDEWLKTAAWVYDNFDDVCGISFLPKSNHVYQLAPYEDITERDYQRWMAVFPQIDYSKLRKYEEDDNTQGSQSYACIGDKCEL
jgi:ribonucleotide reductase class II